MDNNMLYVDGNSTRPSLVRVLVCNGKLHLRKDDDPAFYQTFPFVTASANQVGKTVYLYLDKAGLKYLQYPADHSLAGVISNEVHKNEISWGQKISQQRPVVLLSIFVLLAVGLYLATVNLIPFIGMRVISVEQEIKIGDQLKEVTLKEAPVFGKNIDGKASRTLQSFADGLRLSRRYPIRLTVVNSYLVNAYALPGGNVVIYKGILEKINTPEQLVALLAHESSHINERHTLRSLLRSTANAIIISIVFGDASGISGAIAGHVETLNGLRYSRSLESDADNKGMNLMIENKVDAKGMRQLMQMLQKEDKLPGSLAFFSTHPLTKERVESANNFIRTHPKSFETRQDLQEIFKQLKEELQQ
jgi:beta-barrel assembly-enhancing protease